MSNYFTCGKCGDLVLDSDANQIHDTKGTFKETQCTKCIKGAA